jgi:polysaccharide export outer membrane protein
MSTTIFRSAVAAALLFISAIGYAQVRVENAGTAAAPGSGMPGPASGPVSTPARSGPNSGSGHGVFQPIPAEANGKSTAGPQAIFGLDKQYRVGANDLLDVEVANLDNGKRTVRVNAAGAITMPLIGSVIVAGLTQEQIESHLATLYGEKYLQNPQVAVFIKEFTTQRITLDGAISRPGIYPLVGDMTLLRVIALGGGFASIANSTEVKVFRQGSNGKRQVATFDIDRIRAGKDDDPPIQGDDLIVVQRDAIRAFLKDSVFRDVVDSINPFSVLGPR